MNKRPVVTEAGESSGKRPRKSTSSRPTTAASTGSALMTVETQNKKDDMAIKSFELAATYQRDFWDR